MHCTTHFSAIGLVALVVFVVTNGAVEDWYVDNGFPAIEGLHFPRGDAIAHIDILIDDTVYILEFFPKNMQNTSARIERATEFVDRYMVELIDNDLEFQGIKDREGQFHEMELPEMKMERDKKAELVDLLADQILQETNGHAQSYGNGPIAIKKKWNHGEDLIYHRGAVTIAPSLERFGEWEEYGVEVMSALLCSNKPESPVFDVGANQGLITLALQDLNPFLEYHAFEPQRHLHGVIVANALLRSPARIFSHNVAVGDKREIFTIPKIERLKKGSFAAFGLDQDQNTELLRDLGSEKVQSIRLSSFVFPPDPSTTLALKCPQLIKIDVEGFEDRVIIGAEEIIKRCPSPPALYFESHKGRNVSETMQLVTGSLKYHRCFHHIYSYFREDNFHKNEKDFKTFAPNSDASSNLLCIYQEGWPDCANNISRIEAAILKRELVQVTNQTMNNASVPICNLTPMEANDDSRAWCA